MSAWPMSNISPKWRRLWGIRPDALRRVDIRFRHSGSAPSRMADSDPADTHANAVIRRVGLVAVTPDSRWHQLGIAA